MEKKSKYAKLGGKLREYRYTRKEKIGIKRIAPVLGVEPSYLSKVENGLRRPSLELLNRFIDVYGLNAEESAELYSLAEYGYRGGVISVDDVRDKEKNQQISRVNINPEKTPVLYADITFIKISPNGLVLDFAQQTGPSPQFQVVSRVGLSREHAQTLNKKIEGLLNKNEGKARTTKKRILN